MKKNKNSKRKKHYISNRSDYRQGGRVAFQRGEPVEKDIRDTRTSDSFSISRNEQNKPLAQPPVEMSPPITEAPIMPSQPTSQPAPQPVEMGRPVVPTQPIEYSERELGREININPDNIRNVRMPGGGNIRIPPGGGPPRDKDGNLINDNTSSSDSKDQFEKERGERVVDTGRKVQDIALGKNIPIAEQEVQKIKKGPDSQALQLDDRTGVTASTLDFAGSENVREADTTSATAAAPITTSTMDAAQVDANVMVDAAQGRVSNESLAEAANVTRVPTIDAANVEIPVGALTNRVVGTLSEEAKAIAANNIGTNLARITRAKKQLSNAGLSDAEINQLGNNPDILESQLTDFNETQRGIIEGLPQEALVSTQINSLLEGVENNNIPTWASPAVSAVEQMLAQRGLSASTVGRDNLFNAIIQAALPIAQSNAQAIQQSVSQQRNIESQVAEANAQRRQQTATQNAQNVFNMDMAQFSSDQQIALSNSKFLQTVGLTDASMEQQGVMQDAVLMSQANLTEADFYQKAQIQNAQAFLGMDMANLNNQQTANVLKSQQENQRVLSNQSATNAAAQFNATSENQTRQFMASLQTQVSQFNAQQSNAISQFNAQSANAAEARRLANIADVNKTNAAILNQTAQFNESIDFQRSQFNLQNAQAIEQSNISWRRKANLADTAAQNAVNQQNAQNAFSLTSSAQSFLWQELRDQADYDFRWATDSATRKTNAMIAAASAEGDAAKTWSNNFDKASGVLDRIFGG